MQTRQTRLLDASSEGIAYAAALLRDGGLVGMPTETVYGLAANALNPAAVASIFAAKERPGWDPLIVHVASEAMLCRVVAEISPVARALADAFWPGPMTLLLPRSEEVGDAVTAGRPLVGVRWPAHPLAQALIQAAGVPLAAPSANRFGHISPSTAEHVLADLGGRIDAVVDGGATEIGLESTVLDPNANPITIYREGAVRMQKIERVAGRPAELFRSAVQSEPQSLPSPGVGIRHYAPRTPLQLVKSRVEWNAALSSASGRVVGLAPAGWLDEGRHTGVLWGDWDDSRSLAHHLYASLRALDTMQAGLIVAPLPDERPGDDLRNAVRDRLRKAAMHA